MAILRTTALKTTTKKDEKRGLDITDCLINFKGNKNGCPQYVPVKIINKVLNIYHLKPLSDFLLSATYPAFSRRVPVGLI